MQSDRNSSNTKTNTKTNSEQIITSAEHDYGRVGVFSELIWDN